METMIEKIQQCQSIEDLEKIGFRLTYDIGGRGGYLGAYSSEISEKFDIPQHMLPGKVGAYCNYLGGGVRGSICGSTYHEDTPNTDVLDVFIEACMRIYENEENGIGLNDEEYEDGDTNWDAIATKMARDSGTSSAY